MLAHVINPYYYSFMMLFLVNIGSQYPFVLSFQLIDTGSRLVYTGFTQNSLFGKDHILHLPINSNMN